MNVAGDVEHGKGGLGGSVGYLFAVLRALQEKFGVQLKSQSSIRAGPAAQCLPGPKPNAIDCRIVFRLQSQRTSDQILDRKRKSLCRVSGGSLAWRRCHVL